MQLPTQTKTLPVMDNIEIDDEATFPSSLQSHCQAFT
jgi:hypothetical protein